MSGEVRNFLNVSEVSVRLGVSVSHLNKLRLTGKGPAFVKIGRRVSYDPAALDAWVSQQSRRSTSEQGADA